MGVEIHSVVENANDFYRVAARRTIHDEMPPMSSAARDVETTKTGQNFITRGAAGRVGARR